MLMMRASLCSRSKVIKSFYWKLVTGSSLIDWRLIKTWEIVVACLIFLFYVGQPRLLEIGQDLINPYDLLGRLLGCVAIPNMLDGLLRDELWPLEPSAPTFGIIPTGRNIRATSPPSTRGSPTIDVHNPTSKL
ncbi:unnamed protein product [Prunus armeniaca]